MAREQRGESNLPTGTDLVRRCADLRVSGRPAPSLYHHAGRALGVYRPARSRREDDHPVSVDTLAQSLRADDFQDVTLRKGTDQPLTSRFASVRVRVAVANSIVNRRLLIEWPQGADKPTKYWLSSQPEVTPLRHVGELSVTIRNSSRSSGWNTMWAATGEAFTITLASASWRIASWSLNGYVIGIKKSHCSRHLPYPKGIGRGVVQPAQRHVSDSITKLRWYLHQEIMTNLYNRWRYFMTQ